MPVYHPMRKTPEKTVIDERQSLNDLFSIAYEELRRLAATIRRSDPGATLNPTALVNQAWVKLAAARGFHPTSSLHFKRVAARAMRQLLIESARRRHAEKRGGSDTPLVTFDESVHHALATGRELLALDAALEELARLNPRQAQVVECRYFGGIGVEETAALLGVSDATVLRDWRAARAWLASEVRRER